MGPGFLAFAVLATVSDMFSPVFNEAPFTNLSWMQVLILIVFHPNVDLRSLSDHIWSKLPVAPNI